MIFLPSKQANVSPGEYRLAFDRGTPRGRGISDNTDKPKHDISANVRKMCWKKSIIFEQPDEDVRVIELIHRIE